MPELVGQWSAARCVWETTQTGFCGHSVPFSEIWPISGMTRSGSAYRRPTWEQLIGGSGCSSSRGLLPTARARDGKGRDPNPKGHDLGEAVCRLQFLPTPQANLSTKGGPQDPAIRRARRQSVALDDVISLLPMT